MNERLRIASEQMAALIMADRLHHLTGGPSAMYAPDARRREQNAKAIATMAVALADALIEAAAKAGPK